MFLSACYTPDLCIDPAHTKLKMLSFSLRYAIKPRPGFAMGSLFSSSVRNVEEGVLQSQPSLLPLVTALGPSWATNKRFNTPLGQNMKGGSRTSLPLTGKCPMSPSHPHILTWLPAPQVTLSHKPTWKNIQLLSCPTPNCEFYTSSPFPTHWPPQHQSNLQQHLQNPQIQQHQTPLSYSFWTASEH